jgi:ferrous iron transport protein B
MQWIKPPPTIARAITRPAIVMVGLESSGKSALFRQLTNAATHDEANFRGSTVVVRHAALPGSARDLVDTPGIRARDDSETTRMALAAVGNADTVLLVVRGTHAQSELAQLLRELRAPLTRIKAAIALTFEDKASSAIKPFAQHCRALFGVPVALVNGRAMTTVQRADLLRALATATPVRSIALPSGGDDIPLGNLPVRTPERTLYEHRLIGPWLAALTMLLMFAGPVAAAYLLSSWLQPIADALLIAPLTALFAPLATSAPFAHYLLVGSYGLITLGWYSFLWAFPVVLLIGLSVAITEETGLKDRITAALDPWMRAVGLNGRDLIPVLTGFGCNVVAVFQSRACGACTRKACISAIAFGSACSYQIGASLSLFGAAGVPQLFAPYVLMLCIVGAIHTRIWHKRVPDGAVSPLGERAFLQMPTVRGLWWRVRGVTAQFIKQAMPIFLLICAAATALQYIGVMDWLAAALAPAMTVFGLPGYAAPAVIVSMVRKDGLLILNQGDGALLRTLSTGQLLTLVWLASTLTACMVTLWTIRKELGWRFAVTVASRQVLTSVVGAWLASMVLR